MLDQFNGLPVHVLLVHGAVVLVPLLALAAVAYALVPRLRSRVGWLAALLAVGTPIAVLLAKLSGEKLYDRLVAAGMKGPALDAVDAHMRYGSDTFLPVLGLAVVTGLMIFLSSRGGGDRSLPRAVELGLAAVVVVLAVVSAYYVFRTGDSGAHAVWGTTS